MYGNRKEKEEGNKKARVSVEKAMELRLFLVDPEFKFISLCRIYHLHYFVFYCCGIFHPFYFAASISKYYILI